MSKCYPVLAPFSAPLQGGSSHGWSAGVVRTGPKGVVLPGRLDTSTLFSDTTHQGGGDAETVRGGSIAAAEGPRPAGDVRVRPRDRVGVGPVHHQGRACARHRDDGHLLLGGGIRSASFNLGALQVLRKSGHLGNARYLAAVSGGTYISAAHAAIASLSDREVFENGPAPWAPGSPEERHLRNHSRYLTEGPGGQFWAASSMLWGLLIHLLPLVLSTFLIGRAMGWVLAEVNPRVDATSPNRPTLLLAGLGALLVVSLVALWMHRVVETGLADSDSATLDRLAAVASYAFRAAFFVAAVGLLVPELFAAARTLVTTHEIAGFKLGFADGQHWLLNYVVAQSSVLLGAAGAAWRMRRKLGRFAPLIAALLGPMLLGGPLLYFAYQSAYDGFWGSDAALMAGLLGGAGAVLVWYGFRGHCVRWSPHLFYKERLSSVFMPERVPDGDGQRVTFPYEKTIKMSRLHSPDTDKARMPELVVCAALNISDPVVPPGRGADTFTFTAQHVGCPATGYVPTAEFEGHAGHTPLSLPAMVAISGAAVAPSMGHMTRPWGRFAMAVLNMRLGVWVPNPRRLDAMPVLLTDGSRWDKLRNQLVRGWYEPGPLYVLREALGRNNLKRRFVYVTDGGHWENLGLVELLRRRCTRIICFDAAGDSLDSFNTLAEAIALARSELQVDVDLTSLAPLVPGEDGYSQSDQVVAKFTYPDGLVGDLIFVKAALPIDAPWDVKAYAKKFPKFPCQGTLDQFFDDGQFRAYQALGAHAGENVVATLKALDEEVVIVVVVDTPIMANGITTDLAAFFAGT